MKTVDIKLKTPFFEVGGSWQPNNAERDAAWEIYVQLVTRVATAPMPHDLGSDREVLHSLYALFQVHRDVLTKYGVDVAQSKPSGQYNLGYLAVTTLNLIVRPFLTYWHGRLALWEAVRPENSTELQHEASWPEHGEFRHRLAGLRGCLQTYAGWLSTACGVPSLLA